jgi:hypothetical protein
MVEKKKRKAESGKRKKPAHGDARLAFQERRGKGAKIKSGKRKAAENTRNIEHSTFNIEG